jgi:hypothetical protein
MSKITVLFNLYIFTVNIFTPSNYAAGSSVSSTYFFLVYQFAVFDSE